MLPLPSPQKPLPFITPQAKSLSRWALHPSPDPAALGRGWGWNTELERRPPLAYWVPTGYGHRGKCVPLCECLGAGRWQDPGCLGPRFAGFMLLGSFRRPLWPYFQSGWSVSFWGLGTGTEGESRRPVGGQRGREKGSAASRCDAASSQCLRLRSHFLCHTCPPRPPSSPLLGHLSGCVGTGRSISFVRNRESIPQLCRW